MFFREDNDDEINQKRESAKKALGTLFSNNPSQSVVSMNQAIQFDTAEPC